MLDHSFTSEVQVIGEADRRHLDDLEAAKRAAAADKRKTFRKPVEPAQPDNPKEG